MHTSGRYNRLRRSEQFLLPLIKTVPPEDKYDIYPALKISGGKIFSGFESLVRRIINHRVVTIDGETGVFYMIFQDQINAILSRLGYSARWTSMTDFLKPEDEILKITTPSLSDDDPLFGKRCTLNLEDFFNLEGLASLPSAAGTEISILTGPGASLAGWGGLLIYIDLPKNEIQYRSRAGSVTNLGLHSPAPPKEMYRRFYFVDWVLLNKHKKKILPSIDLFIDGQQPDMPVWMEGNTLRESLHFLSRNLFRARPWFEPGAWGGTWIKNNIAGLNKDVPNYAWSFELITPENGLLFESSSLLCEVSFDFLMFQEAEAVLGESFEIFGTSFPIRFDFLDTFDGGNLSLQCHPRPGYIKEHFGEDYTQEETYYILDTKDNAEVFLGFSNDISPETFRNDLENSLKNKTRFDPDKHILRHPVKKHDLLLIPYGTIHGSGKNNLVLEISTTPYIFTFKMYDWLRPDLDGNPRPLNIERGMENLYFSRKGDYVRENLIASPVLLSSGPDWKLFRLPTHTTHSYDVHRYHFYTLIEVDTENRCLVMSLVEGVSIDILTKTGYRKRFSFAETFVVPAAAEKVWIFNNSRSEALLVKAFINIEKCNRQTGEI